MLDPFNRPMLTPDAGAEARVTMLRTLAGELQAADSPGQRWLGRKLSAWLHAGGRLEHVLGVTPQRGSRRTAQALVQRDQQDVALLALSAAIGSDAAAARILAGALPCPPQCEHALNEVVTLRCARSPDAFGRARRRVNARHGR